MNTLSNGLRLRLLCGLALTLLACDLDSKDLNGGTGTGTDTDTDTGTGDTGDLPAGCEAITEKDLCDAEADACVWRTGVRARRDGDSCDVDDTGVCFDVAILDGDAGCADLEGCTGLFASPFFRVEPNDDVTLVDFCGGTPPETFTACNSGLASVAQPPECACVCEFE